MNAHDTIFDARARRLRAPPFVHGETGRGAVWLALRAAFLE
ncbi:hypothetical protein [Paraburkholderia acidisoli]|nr:hypothetical protein [Paraburkholderia acidisoli]